ncbi:MAG: inositol monophosphatase [Anaerolineae bacterium]|nr:inositol monophosphatase [Anaerolineae bacterium]
MDFSAAVDTVAAIARAAGDIILRHYAAPVAQSAKTTAIDIVTAADTEAEALIVAALRDHFPDHAILGEEGGAAGQSAATADYCWYVDPIDGTVNFAARLPYFCTSIALADQERRPLLGVVYDPTRRELFSAVRGSGAFLNGQPLRVSSTPTLLQSVVTTGFPYDRFTNPDNNLKEWTAFLTKVRGERRLGAAALDFAYVAAARLDGYWEKDLKLWDVMAGILLVQEAGGTVTDYAGADRPQRLERGRYVASNGHIHGEMLAVLASV